MDLETRLKKAFKKAEGPAYKVLSYLKDRCLKTGQLINRSTCFGCRYKIWESKDKKKIHCKKKQRKVRK